MTDQATGKANAAGKPAVRQEVPVTSRRDPFATVRDLEAEMDRWMDAIWPFGRRSFLVPSRELKASETVWAPRMDVYRKDNHLVIQAELPGMKPEDVEVTIEAGDLIIHGEKKSEKEIKEGDYYRTERTYGEFYRRQPLPEGIKPEDVKAIFANGVLEVRIPTPAATKPETHKIAVTAKE